MKKLIVIGSLVFIALTSSHQAYSRMELPINMNVIQNDTLIVKRILELEKRSVVQENQIKELRRENELLKSQQSSKQNIRTERSQKRFTVTRVGSKQWVRNYETVKKPEHNSVDWNSLKR